MIAKREVEYAKELDDVAALLVHVVKEAKAGKPAAEIASGSVAKLIDALAGVDQLPEEFKHRGIVFSTLGYRIGELSDAILGEKPTGAIQL